MLLDKTVSVFEKYIYNFLGQGTEMPSQENQHCADCIGAFSFPVPINIEIGRRVCTGQADMTSGVARNFRQGVRKSVAFLSVHSRLAALPSDRPYNQKVMTYHSA